jgi:type I restriction enzyme, S subunit
MKKGWQTKRLGDVCEIIKGRKPALKATQSAGDLPYLVAKVMRGSEDAQYASPKDRNSVPVAKSETIIICDGSNSGEVFTGFQGILSSTMGKISKKAEIDDDYLRAFLASTFEVFNGSKTGAAIPHLDKEAMYQLAFPLPPLPEQERIVGILDEAFENIATCKANAEKNLQNARAIFESHLQSVFTQRGSEWGEKTLEEVCIIGDGNHSSNYPRKDELVEVGIPFIRATNLVAGQISGSDMRFLSPQKHAQLKKGHLKTGDILITNRGEIGKTAIVDSDYDNANLNSQIAWLRCREGMDNRFLFYVLNSDDIQQHFQSSMSGAALQQFTIKQLKALRVPSPPVAQQEALVEQLDALSEKTQRLASLYRHKLVALDGLKKSLLHEAFVGAL